MRAELEAELESPQEQQKEQQKKAYARAIYYLARREYGARELALVLQRKGFPPEIIESLISRLEKDGSLSDERFAEMFIRARIARGFGPVRIGNELRQRGVADDIVETYLNAVEDWDAHAVRVHRKKFGSERPGDQQEKARRWRYLQYKGFTSEQIGTILMD